MRWTAFYSVWCWARMIAILGEGVELGGKWLRFLQKSLHQESILIKVSRAQNVSAKVTKARRAFSWA